MRPPHATAVGRTSSACLAVVLAAALGLWTAPAAAVQETATWKADPALGNWNTAANWEGGVVPNNAGGTTYAVLVDGGKGAVDSTVNVDAHVTIDTLTVDTGDTVAINGSRSLTLAGGTLANAGTVALNATSAITSLKIATDVALSGGGIVELSNSPWNRIQGVAGTERLTNLDNTLRGSGLLGPNLLALTNQGLIEANQSIALTLDPNAGGVTNTGILQANGGTLVLTEGTFTNTGGTIRALDGSNVDLENGTQIVGGTLTTAGTGQVRSVGAGVVLEDLTSAGQYVITNSRSTALKGTIQNTGALAMAAAGSVTYLYAATDTVTLTGGGTVTLSNSIFNMVRGTVGTERLINQDNAIRGSGRLGLNLLALTNQGLIEANQSIALTLDPNASGVTNTGILQANGGTLVLTEGTFTNTGGTIRALDGSNVDLENGTQIVGGTLTTAGTGQVRSVGAGVVLEDLTSAGQCVIANSSSTALRGTIQNTGALAMAAAGSVTYLYAATDTVTLTGGGTVTLSNSIFNYVRGTVGTERLINQDNAIRGSGHLGLNLLALTNQGLIEANQSIALALDPNAGGVLNEGTLRASGAGGLSLTAGTFTNTGTVEAAGGNVTFTASAAITNYNAGALTLTGGAWKALAGSTLSFAGDPAIAVNAADVTLSGPGSAFGSIDSLAANAAAGQFHVLGGRTFTTLAGLSNAGRVDVGTGSTLAVTGDYTQTGGLTAVNGLLTATGTIGIQAGTLAGAGTVTGAAVLGGTLSPGNSIDTLTFSALTVQGNAVYDFQISGAASDRADVTGAGGAFRIDPAGDYTVNVTILGFAGALGPHDMFTWVGDDPLTPHEWGALQYTANFQPGVTGQWLYLPDENRMVLNILTVPEPATLALMGLGLAALLRRRRAA